MERFKNLHLWMVIPFIVVQLTIFNYYWPSFRREFWEIHIHYWLITLWYILIIVQSYLAVTGRIINHRTLGIIGFVLAGGAIFTGFSLLDFPLRLMATLDPSRPGPPISFYYGTIVVEFVLMVAFTYSIIKSIVHRKELNEHAWWLICSAFLMMPPALGRGLIVFWRAILHPENFNPMIVFVSTEVIYVPLFLLFAFKFGKIKHPATIIVLGLVVFRFLRIPIGSMEVVQSFLGSVIKYF